MMIYHSKVMWKLNEIILNLGQLNIERPRNKKIFKVKKNSSFFGSMGEMA